MTSVQAVILGIVQGLTEFLPISSSGHLVLFQRLFGMTETALLFNVSVHVGTLAAILVFYRLEIVSIFSSLGWAIGRMFGKKNAEASSIHEGNLKFVLFVVIASIPTAIIGLLFREIADQLFSSVFLVGAALIVTGSLLWTTKWIKGEGVRDFSAGKSFLIGIMQGIAIIPGISRSGSTIVTGLFLGIDRETAARFSFLLSVPAIIGAELLSLKGISPHELNQTLLWGALASGITGYAALRLLIFIIKQSRLHLFSFYCWTVGLAALILGWT